MKIDYNVRGEQRKAPAAAISQVLQTPAQYKGAPTFSYQIGELFLDKNGKPYIVSFVVNKLTSELSDMDVLHAINTKKESAAARICEEEAFISGFRTGARLLIEVLGKNDGCFMDSD